MNKIWCPGCSPENCSGCSTRNADEALSVPAVPHQVIAGALFDFLGFLTTRDEVTPFGSSAEAAPAVDLLTAWAKTNGLHLNEADVQGWRNNITGGSNG